MLFGTVALVGGVPFAVALVGLLLVWKAGDRFTLPHRQWLSGWVVAIGYLCGHALAQGVPSLKPADATQRLFLLVAVAAFVGIVEAFGQERMARAVRLWRFLFALLGMGLLLRPATGYLVFGKVAVWTVAYATGMGVVWTLVNGKAERQQGVLIAAALFPLCLFQSAALLVGHTASISQLAGVLATILGAVALVGTMKRDLTMANGAVGVVITALFGTVALGMFFADLPPIVAILLLLSPVAMLLSDLPFLRVRPLWQQAFVQVAGVTFLAALALIISIWQLGFPQV